MTDIIDMADYRREITDKTDDGMVEAAERLDTCEHCDCPLQSPANGFKERCNNAACAGQWWNKPFAGLAHIDAIVKAKTEDK